MDDINLSYREDDRVYSLRLGEAYEDEQAEEKRLDLLVGTYIPGTIESVTTVLYKLSSEEVRLLAMELQKWSDKHDEEADEELFAATSTDRFQGILSTTTS